MAKVSKNITIKYRNSLLPENLGEVLSNADENDLKVLIALMMAADENGEVNGELPLADALGDPSINVDAAIKFWRGAGIISSPAVTKKKTVAPEKSEAQAPEQKTEALSEQTPPGVESAHRNGAVEQNTGVSNYRTGELADLFEKRAVSAEFIDEAQRVFGKTFNSYDTNIVVGLVDQLGFDEEAVLSILAYVVRIGKKGVRYCEKVALNLYDDGYTKGAEVENRIAVIERSAHIISKIKQLYGIGDRSLSQTEKTLFNKWTQDYGYDIDIIKFAYDITVDRTQKGAPKYTNAIIEGWHNEGLTTLEAIKEFEQRKRDAQAATKENAANGDKSYDLDGFVEAALKRSFEDLK